MNLSALKASPFVENWSSKSLNYQIRRPLICVASIFAFTVSAQSASVTWDGGGAPANVNWSNGVNWSGDVAPLDFDFLTFDGTAGLNNTNDFAAGTLFGGITFSASAGDFVLGGNAISLGGNLTSNKTTGTATINLDLALTTPSTVFVRSGSTLTIGGAVTGFVGVTKNGLGTLSLSNALNDYSGSTTVNGGVLSLGTTGALSNFSTLTLGNGEFALSGGAGAPRTQALGLLTLNAGRGIVTLAANAAQPVSLTFDSLGNRAVGATTLYRGSGLGTAAPGTAGAANLLFTTAPTAAIGHAGAFVATGTGTLGSTQAAVLRGALADASAAGNGAGFATYDLTNGVRLLNPATEQTTAYSTAVAGDNVLINLTGATSITGKTTNTLQVNNTSGGALTLTNSGTVLWPNNGLLFTGNSATTLTGGTLTFTNASGVNNDMIIMSTNTATVTIATTLASGGTNQRSYAFGGSGNFIITAANVGSSNSGGNYFNGPGTVELRGNNYGASSLGTIVNGGTLRLGAGFGQNSNNSRAYSIAVGATFDINNYTFTSTGVSGAAAGLDAFNNVDGGGGTVTNSGGTMTSLTLSLNNNAGDFAGVVSGNINLILNKQGTTTRRIQKFTNALTYAGSTGVTAANTTGEVTAFLTLGAGGSLPVTTAVTLGGVIGTAGVAEGNGVLTLGDTNGAVNQTIASLASGGTGTANAVVAGNGVDVSMLTVNGSASTTFGGTLGGPSFPNDNLALTRAGTGTLTLTGASTYTGGTTISGGTLRANNLTGSATGIGAVTVGSGGTLGGTGFITGPVAVNLGGILSPGAGVGTLTVGALTLSAGSILDYEFGAGVNDVAIVSDTNGLTINGGGFHLYQQGSTLDFSAPGTYQLLQFSGALAGNPATTLSVLNQSAGRTYSFGQSGSFVTLTITATATNATWATTTGGSWASGPSWSTNPTIPNSAGAAATFGTSLAAPGTVTLDGNKTVGAIEFSNSTNSYTIATGSGGTLVLDNGGGAATITASLGSHGISASVNLVSANTAINVVGAADVFTVSGAISGSGALTKSGNGTLALTGANSFTGGTVIGGGVARISSDANLGAASGGLSVGNAVLQFLSSVLTARNVQISSSGSTFQVDNSGILQLDGLLADGATPGTLNKTGNGTVILNGSTSYTGGTVIGAGLLQVGTGGATGALGSGPVVIDGALVIERTGALSITGALSGAGPLTMNGGGALTLGAASGSYTGIVTITGGTLNLGANGAAGTGPLTLNNVALTENNVSTTHANAVELQGAITIDTFGSTTLTLNGNVSGSAAVTRSGGTGSLTFGGINSPTFTGTFTNNLGNVTFTRKEAGSSAAQWAFNAGSVTLNNMGGTINFGALSGTANIAATGSTARVRVGDLGMSSAYSGNFSAASNGISLLKTGSGTLTLSGQSANFTSDAITGLTGFNTVITGGAIVIGSSTTGTATGPLGGSGANVLLGNNGTVANASLLLGGAFTLGNPITISGGTASSSGYTLTLGGNTDSAASVTGAITLQNDLTISQVATTGNNALTLSGAISGTALGTGPGGASPNNTGTQTLTFAGPGAMVVAGPGIGDGAGIVGVRTTGGVTTLSGVNTYTGATQVTVGTLLVNGGIVGSATTVSGTLGGNGTTGPVTVNPGGIVAPGNSTGILSTGDFNLLGGGIFSIELGGTSAGTGYDQLNVNGAISLAGELQGSLIGGFNPNPGDLFFIILNDAADSVSGAFANAASSVTFGNATFNVFYAADSGSNATSGGNDVALMLVPEPSAALLLLGGMGTLLGLRRPARRKRICSESVL